MTFRTLRLQMAVVCAATGLASVASLAAQGEGAAAHPDFTGVWRTVNAQAAPRTNTTLRWRPADNELPPFTPEYVAKFNKIQQSRETGSEETESVARCLPHFGPYEDAMSERSRGVFHTRISPSLNLGRIRPQRLVDDVVRCGAPLQSVEGFVRQVIGWREFVRHVHRATDGFRVVGGADRKSTRLNSSHVSESRMPSSA